MWLMGVATPPSFVIGLIQLVARLAGSFGVSDWSAGCRGDRFQANRTFPKQEVYKKFYMITLYVHV